MYKILGFNVFTSKAGKTCMTLQLCRDFTQAEQKNGSIGYRVVKRNDGGDFFVPDHLHHLACEENVGKYCDIWFNASNGIAQIIISE